MTRPPTSRSAAYRSRRATSYACASIEPLVEGRDLDGRDQQVAQLAGTGQRLVGLVQGGQGGVVVGIPAMLGGRRHRGHVGLQHGRQAAGGQRARGQPRPRRVEPVGRAGGPAQLGVALAHRRRQLDLGGRRRGRWAWPAGRRPRRPSGPGCRRPACRPRRPPPRPRRASCRTGRRARVGRRADSSLDRGGHDAQVGLGRVQERASAGRRRRPSGPGPCRPGAGHRRHPPARPRRAR